MTFAAKLFLYFRSAQTIRSFNMRGFPLIPKLLWRGVPHSRNAYNSFLLWIHRLGLASAKTILDVGANHGDFAQAASTLFPAAKVFVFEPLPAMQEHLKSLINSRRDNWRLVPCALGSEAGEFPLFVDDQDDTIGSFTGFTDEYLKANPRAHPSRKIMCQVQTLDQAATEQGIDSIDLLKIDVEGFEFEVLKGGEHSLQRTQAVIIEVSLIRRASEAADPLLETLAWFTRAGFHVVEIIPSLFDPSTPWKPVEFNLLMRRSGCSHDSSRR